MNEKLLNLAEVEGVVGVKKSLIYKLVGEGKFPRGVLVGRARRWPASHVQNWIEGAVEVAVR